MTRGKDRQDGTGVNGRSSNKTRHATTTRSSARPRVLWSAIAATAVIGFSVTGTSRAADTPAATYPRLAPANEYLMPRDAEIALARSAAPSSISTKATVMVLTDHGFEEAVHGTNGFLCWVGRGLGGAPDWPERFNPKIRAAECLNPEAARSIAPIAKLRTQMTLAGKTDAEIEQRLTRAMATGEIPKLEPGSMSYMMSKDAYLQDQAPHSMAHVMFFFPARDGADWGANMPGAPIFGGSYWFLTPGRETQSAKYPPLSVFLIGTSNWSDGSTATMAGM